MEEGAIPQKKNFEYFKERNTNFTHFPSSFISLRNSFVAQHLLPTVSSILLQIKST